MTDSELQSAWIQLEPSARRRARIETRVFDWLEARETSIAGEWVALLRVEPLVVLASASAGAIALMLLSPVGWFLTSAISAF